MVQRKCSIPARLTDFLSAIRKLEKCPVPFGKPGIASKPLKGCLDLAEEGLAGGHEVVCGFLKAGGDSLFTLGEVGTGIVVLLVAHFTVNLEHSVDVFAHVGDDRAREGVLRIGVDVHLDHAVGNGFADVGKLGTGTAVEDEGHAGRFAVLGDHGFLAVAQVFSRNGQLWEV